MTWVAFEKEERALERLELVIFFTLFPNSLKKEMISIQEPKKTRYKVWGVCVSKYNPSLMKLKQAKENAY